MSWTKDLGNLGTTERQRCHEWSRNRVHDATHRCHPQRTGTEDIHRGQAKAKRNSHLGPLEWHLSTRVWKTAETKSKIQKRSDSWEWGFLALERVQPPHSLSLKGSQNLSQISGTQCKSPFPLFCPKIKMKNLRGMILHLTILIKSKY